MNDDMFQLKVTLRESGPPIWRTLLVPGSYNLRQVHEVLQVVMGWTNSHLYEFVHNGVTFGEPDDEYPNETRPAARMRLATFAPRVGSRLVYRYDLGDDWQHEVEVEAITPVEAR